MSEADEARADGERPGETRRGFIEWASLIIGALLGLAPLGLGLLAFLDPLRRKKPPRAYEGGGDDFVRVASLAALTVGAAPQRFPVIADRRDAWNYLPKQPIGAVFVQRTAESEVRVFNATCPHAGCSVSNDGEAYNCPCHNSSFNLDGSKRVSRSGRENPSPRDLDRLEVDPQRLAEGEVWVKFMNFYTGKEEPIPKP